MNAHELNPKTQRIIRWRETLSTMEDERFFEIMRIYLGEIHTPFNKDKLIEQLSSIFRKEENKNTIISYLSEFDKKIITAISFIDKCTQQKLIDFFESEYFLSDIYSELINLNERLIIYSYKDSDTGETFIALNPILEDHLACAADLRLLFPAPSFIQKNFNPHFSISPSFIAAFYSYILENPGMCKNNTEIKKRDAERLSEIFTGHYDCVQLLLASFFNLGLIKFGEKDIFADTKKFEKFAQLEEIKQYAYIAAASVTRLSRQSLQSQAQLLLNTIASIPETGLSLDSVFRTAFIIKYKKNNIADTPAQSRFSRLLESYKIQPAENLSEEIIYDIIKNAVSLGLLQEAGKDESENPIVMPGEIFKEKQNPSAEKKGILNINAGTSIAILPGLSLEELLPLATFLNIVSFNTVCEFEISKKSIYRALDREISEHKIIEYLSKYNAYRIPQSLLMNIEEWKNSYSSAILFKGYILKVDEKNQRIIENNPKISSFINSKLAEGIYLLNIPLNEEPSDFIAQSGLEILSTVKTSSQKTEALAFPFISEGKNLISLETQNNPAKTESKENLASTKTAEEIKSAFLAYIDTIELTKQQKECLANRIKKNIILTKEQLKPETVRLEILEADGMNFSGKIHLIENAINHSDMLEITVPAENKSGKMEKFFGKPLLIIRQTNDSMLKMQLDNSEETKIFSVSRINHAKIIKTSVF